MSFRDKRPRPSSTQFPINNIINISSDEDSDHELPKKRQKSLTPARNNAIQAHAKPSTGNLFTIASTPPPPTQPKESPDNGGHSPAKKVSPFRNRPSWQKPTTPVSNQPKSLNTSSNIHGNPTQRSQRDIFKTESDRWSTKDIDRFQELSIYRRDLQPASQVARNANGNLTGSSKRPTITNSPLDLEQERKEIVDKFKLPTATSLKFNPNSLTPTLAPSSSNDARRSQVASPSHQLLKAPRQSSGYISATVQTVQTVRPTSSVEGKVPPRPKPSELTQLLLSESASSRHAALNREKPSQPSKFFVNVPPTDTAKLQQRRKALREKLKQGVSYAQENPEEVEKVLGWTGFAKAFPTNLDEDKYKKAAQPKKRAVDRSRLLLDLGPTPRQPTTSDGPLDLVHPKDQAKAILIARFVEHFEPSLSFSNTVNDRRLNGKFQFVSDYILRKGVRAVGTIGQPTCSCVGGCNNGQCACLVRTFKDSTKRERSEWIPQYRQRPDGLIILRDDFIERHAIRAIDDEAGSEGDVRDRGLAVERVEISECNEHCPCDSSCINRVVQKGRTVPLEIFETKRCGFGVRSSANLVRGQFIEFYLGEVITDNELIRREEAAEAGSTSYIYSLDWFSSHQPYHIDGENFGSAMRFVNHSCEPNAGTFPVLNNKSTKQLHYVAFFAIQDIPAGVEITIDYTPQASGTIYELNTADDGMEKCYCGAKKCRQMLWLPGKERKARKKIIGRSFE